MKLDKSLLIKLFFYTSLSFLILNFSLAKDINIQENINLGFVCELDKKIIKNSEYNYQTFLAKDLDAKGLDKFEIEAIKPEKLFIEGLSLFLSNSEKLNVKVVNKDIVLFKAIDQKRISHSMLFFGAIGSGTLALAIAFARLVLCQDKPETSSCHIKASKFQHPDLHFVFPVVKKGGEKVFQKRVGGTYLSFPGFY